MALPERLPTLSVKESADALGVHPSTIYRWVGLGELTVVRYGRAPAPGDGRRGAEIRIPEHVIAERLRRGPVAEATPV